jgi:hypothetical protein
MRHLKSIVLAVIMLTAWIFAAEPVTSSAGFREKSVLPLLNKSTTHFTKAQSTQVKDTITWTTINNNVFIPWISISVTDTMESTNDTARVDIYAGTTLLLTKFTKDFKLPGSFRWDVNKYVTGAITVRHTIQNITEGSGTWFVPFLQINPATP